VSDATGVVISRQDAPRDAIVATVTPGRVNTIYALVGDLFAYGCIAGFLFLTALSLRRTYGGRAPTSVGARMPAVGQVAMVMLASCFLAITSAAQEQTALARADAALESCIAAAKNNDEPGCKTAADQADRGYDEAERSGAAKAHVLTGRARVLSQCRVRYAGFLQQPGLVKRSIALLQQAIAADPNHTLAHYTLAMNYYHAPKVFGQTDDALGELELIVKRWGTRRDLPVVGDAYFFLGRVYERLGRTKDAEATWKKGAELFPANARLKRAAGGPAT
jgi:tetratricopeptide (TPR) repeat protein